MVSAHDPTAAARLRDALADRRLLAILRGGDRAATVAAAITLVECGVDIVEISLSGTDALDALAEVVDRVGGDALVGAGTVVDATDARRAAAAGATFVVTPGLVAGTATAAELGLPVLVGALTPTEVITATGVAAAVKLFPASLGGVEYLRALRAPFPDVPFVPVGGVDAELAAAYLAAGALAVGVGSPLVGDAAEPGGDLEGLRKRAREFLQAVAR